MNLNKVRESGASPPSAFSRGMAAAGIPSTPAPPAAVSRYTISPPNPPQKSVCWSMLPPLRRRFLNFKFTRLSTPSPHGVTSNSRLMRVATLIMRGTPIQIWTGASIYSSSRSTTMCSTRLLPKKSPCVPQRIQAWTRSFSPFPCAMVRFSPARLHLPLSSMALLIKFKAVLISIHSTHP